VLAVNGASLSWHVSLGDFSCQFVQDLSLLHVCSTSLVASGTAIRREIVTVVFENIEIEGVDQPSVLLWQ
jgi:hypothetical protein